MSRKKRRILFFVSIVLFILALGPVLFYTFGYNLSWKDFTLTSRGGISIVTQPTSSFVKIDTTEKTSSLLGGSVFLQNLKPGPHTVEVWRDGFVPWKKTLTVKPHFVTEARVILIPKDPDNTVLTQGTYEEFTASPNASVIILKEKNESASSSLLFYNTANKIFLSYSGTSTKLIAKKVNALPSNIIWSEDEQSATAELDNDWVHIRFSERSVEIESIYKQKPDLRKKFPKKPSLVLPHPGRADNYYILEGENLSLWNNTQSNLNPILNSVAGLKAYSNNLLILDSASGFLYRTTLEGGSPVPVSLSGIRGSTQTIIETSNDSFIIKSNTGLWHLDPKETSPELLAATTSFSTFRTSGANAIWWNPRSIRVRWTIPERDLPSFQTSLLDTAWESGENIKAVFYYPGEHYLVILAGETVYVAEFDSRGDSQNVVPMYKGENPSIFVPTRDRVVYILDKGILTQMNLQ